MSDLVQTLPHFPLAPHTHLIPSLERSHLTTTDLLTLPPAEIARRARLPALDVRRLTASLLAHLHRDLAPHRLPSTLSTISTLSPALDRHLSGFPTGHLTEITGESSTGKTQLLLQLLLSVQLPPPHGLAASSLYLSTEHPLPTARLASLLASNPLLSPASLSAIHTIHLPDLETQSHILTYQLPLLLARQPIRLVVLDSVAANYRAEAYVSPAALASRSRSLVRLGAQLRHVARTFDVAVVVANQVSDRFVSSSQEGEVMALDHQQNWFTGWKAEDGGWEAKTPALGHAWSVQLSGRIALVKRTVGGEGRVERRLRVVFAPWVGASAERDGEKVEREGVEFVIEKGGVRAVDDAKEEERCEREM